MSDLDHVMGGDLSIGPTGDLGAVSGDAASRQRVLRRLLTNAGEYVWAPDYGAGLAAFVGQTARQSVIEAVIRAQMLLEGSVARRPLVSVALGGGADGTVAATVTFADRAGSGVSAITTDLGGQ